MIQRIQTIYLFIAGVLALLVCFFPTAYVGDTAICFGGKFIIYSVLCAVIPLLSFASIFFYKRRVLQMRLNSFNIILMLFQLIAIAVNIYLTQQELPDAAFRISWPATLPLINVILTYLAIRAIGKDEALVRSLNRLRK